MIEKGNTIGEHLKYHRLSVNLTQNELAKIIGFSNGACIKDIELGRKLPGREISKKLASFFKLDSTYFFDTYLEDTDNAADILKSYREKNSLTVKKACAKLNISQTTWLSWENRNSYISRDKYKLLKKHKIL